MSKGDEAQALGAWVRDHLPDRKVVPLPEGMWSAQGSRLTRTAWTRTEAMYELARSAGYQGPRPVLQIPDYEVQAWLDRECPGWLVEGDGRGWTARQAQGKMEHYGTTLEQAVLKLAMDLGFDWREPKADAVVWNPCVQEEYGPRSPEGLNCAPFWSSDRVGQDDATTDCANDELRQAVPEETREWLDKTDPGWHLSYDKGRLVAYTSDRRYMVAGEEETVEELTRRFAKELGSGAPQREIRKWGKLTPETAQEVFAALLEMGGKELKHFCYQADLVLDRMMGDGFFGEVPEPRGIRAKAKEPRGVLRRLSEEYGYVLELADGRQWRRKRKRDLVRMARELGVSYYEEG